MGENFWKRAVAETLISAVFAAVLCLFAAALLAVFVRAYAPSDFSVALLCRLTEVCAVFAVCLLFVRRERAFFKGAAAGALTVLLTMLLFGAIGGFHLSVFFLFRPPLCALAGGLGAVCGTKLRKE